MQRSAAPLHVFVAQAPGTVTEDHLPLLHILQAMLDRVQRLTIWSDRNAMDLSNSLFAHIHQATPLLQSIRIRIFCDEGPSWSVPHRLLSDAPLLSEVYLFNVPLMWFECSHWEHAETVTLVDCAFDLEHLLVFGSWWPNMRNLTIEQVNRFHSRSNTDRHDAAQRGAPAPVLLPLPHLEILQLRSPLCPSVFYRARTRLRCLESMLIRSTVPLSASRIPTHAGDSDEERAYFFKHCAPNLVCLTIETSLVSRGVVHDVLATAPRLRELHLVEADVTSHFFTALLEHMLPSFEELSFYGCRFLQGAPAAFAHFAELQACASVAQASSSTPAWTPRHVQLKKLSVSQISKVPLSLPLPILARIRAAVPFAEMEEIHDF